MSFPPADVLASEALFYRLMGLAADLRPLLDPLGLSAEVDHSPTTLTQYVKIPLPTGGNVILLFHHGGAWVIGGPAAHGKQGDPTAWPLDTSNEDLLAATAEQARAFSEGTDVRSPWRWGRTVPSPVTDLADQLVALGGPIEDIAVPRPLYIRGTELRRNDRPSETVVLTTPQSHLEVALQPTIGWTVDLDVDDEPGSRGRMDLRFALLGVREPRPDMPADLVSINQLASLLAEEAGFVEPSGNWRPLVRCAPTPRPPNSDQRIYEIDPEERDACTVAAWLRWCGYTDAASAGDRRRSRLHAAHIAVHLHRAKASAGLAVVQQALGQATAAGRRSAVASRSGFTREAVRWADEAGVALFRVERDEAPRPASAVGRELMPDPGERLPTDCDDNSCRDMGCMLDDDQCPTEIGRRWSDTGSPLWQR